MSKRQSITVSDKQDAFLQREAARLGITVSDLIRRIVDWYRDAPRLGAEQVIRMRTMENRDGL